MKVDDPTLLINLSVEWCCILFYESNARRTEQFVSYLHPVRNPSFHRITNELIGIIKACGVCSSAQDFGARIKTYGSLETESIICATSYTFSRDFPALVQCYAKLGFTESCATLWAHFAATNGSKCAFNCLPGSSGITEVCVVKA